MKSSKTEIQAKYHKIPVIRFEDQKLTSFSGLLIFQVLFRQLRLKERLRQCFEHMKVSPIFGRHLVVLLLIVHLLIGFRRLLLTSMVIEGLKREMHLIPLWLCGWIR